MQRTWAIAILLFSTAASAAEPDHEASPLVGPFATLAAYCQTLPTRKPARDNGDDRIAHMTCAPPPKPREDDGERSTSCHDPEFAALPHGVLIEAKMLELREGNGKNRPACLLAWRTAAGWFVDEFSDFQPSVWYDDDGGSSASRVQDQLVAAKPTESTTGHGVVGRVRERSVRRAGMDEVDCVDFLHLYGLGPSNKLSMISYEVGELDRCSDVAEAGEKRPPSRWDWYRIDVLLPDGRLRLTQVGRHKLKSEPRVAEHALPFL